jgi:hypothetical protein
MPSECFACRIVGAVGLCDSDSGCVKKTATEKTHGEHGVFGLDTPLVHLIHGGRNQSK